jgi:plasmid maintenance system killer protein
VGLADSETGRFFKDGRGPARRPGLAKVMARKLDVLDAATSPGDLRSPPGNRPESLKRIGRDNSAIASRIAGASAMSGQKTDRILCRLSIIAESGLTFESMSCGQAAFPGGINS